jgi:hypothetical protein
MLCGCICWLCFLAVYARCAAWDVMLDILDGLAVSDG